MGDNSRVFSFILKKYAMYFVLVGVMIMFEFLIRTMGKGSLFHPTNISNLIGQNGYVVILATGMLLCILTGGNIDLSVGSIVALIGALAGEMLTTYSMNPYTTIVVCLLTGILVGALQGVLIAYLRIPAFIVTLAGMLIFRGIAWVILKGITLAPFPEAFKKIFNTFLPVVTGSANDPETKKMVYLVSMIIGIAVCVFIIVFQLLSTRSRRKRGYVDETWQNMVKVISTALACGAILFLFDRLGNSKGTPIALIWIALVVIGYTIFTTKMVVGRHFYAMGGNEKATKLSGINTNRILLLAYTNMGLLTAFASMICVARFNSAAPSAGTNYEMDAIAACYIGGASSSGGIGTVGGAVIGAIFMGIMNNGMSILGIASDWQRVIKGLVLLLAVILDVSMRRNNSLTYRLFQARKLKEEEE